MFFYKMSYVCFILIAVISSATQFSMAEEDNSRDCAIIRALQEHGHILLSKILPCGYRKDYPPPTEDKSKIIEVEVALYIQDLNSINAADMDFRIDVILYMSWEDFRLNVSAIVNGTTDADEIFPLPAYALQYLWVPDPYIANSKQAAITSLTTTFASLTIHSNHTVRYRARLYSLVACQMEFQKYPMDVQICPIRMQSFKYSNQQMKFRWRDTDAVKINPHLKLLQFAHKIIRTYTSNTSASEFGGYGDKQMTALVTELEFSRLIGYHVVMTYVPSFLIVALSWFSFYTRLDAIPGRVTLLVTCLLTLTTLYTGLKNDTPRVAYIRAIDLWMLGCIMFAFAAMGEFIVCKVFHYHMKKESESGPPKQMPETSGNPFEKTPSYTQTEKTNTLNSVSVISGNKKKVQPTIYPEWVPPEEVDRDNFGFNSDDEYPAKITKINGKHIDLSRSVNDAGGRNHGSGRLPNSVTFGYGVVRRYSDKAVIIDMPNFKDSQELTMKRRRKARSRWVKSMREMNMQWDDPVTGDKKILWEEIDNAARVVFPVLFLIFCLIYFPLLMLL